VGWFQLVSTKQKKSIYIYYFIHSGYTAAFSWENNRFISFLRTPDPLGVTPPWLPIKLLETLQAAPIVWPALTMLKLDISPGSLISLDPKVDIQRRD
jgi:hypothetical protein